MTEQNYTEDVANAEFTERACNNYYPMLQALKIARPLLENYVQGAPEVAELIASVIANAEANHA